MPLALRSFITPAVAAPAARVIRHLEEAKNVIVQGPPKVGKTWLTRRVVDALGGGDVLRLSDLAARHEGAKQNWLKDPELGEKKLLWEAVQLHPGSSYDTFVRGLRAVSEGGKVRFEPVDGPLLDMIDAAACRPNLPCLLILEDLGRCNLASVLGEAIVGMEADKRDSAVVRLKVPPPEGGQACLRFPGNLLVLGTLDTADRAVAAIDFAIRRRFRFIDIEPDPQVLIDWYGGDGGERASRLLTATNALVEHSGRSTLAFRRLGDVPKPDRFVVTP